MGKIRLKEKSIKIGAREIEEQRAIARSLIYDLTGKKMRHSKTGRPFVKKPVDISVSHKNSVVCAAAIPMPYKIGVDVEYLKARLNAKLFLGPVITTYEFPFFKKFCKFNNFSRSSGIAIFWSIKESFLKCLDYDLKPGKINVLGISKKGKVRLDFSNEIKTSMEERKLKFCSTEIVFENKYIFSQTIMKKALLGISP